MHATTENGSHQWIVIVLSDIRIFSMYWSGPGEQPDEFPENRTTAPEFSECRYRGAGSGVVLLLGFWCRVLVRVSSHVEVVGVVWWCSSGPVLSSILAQARLRPQN